MDQAQTYVAQLLQQASTGIIYRSSTEFRQKIFD